MTTATKTQVNCRNCGRPIEQSEDLSGWTWIHPSLVDGADDAKNGSGYFCVESEIKPEADGWEAEPREPGPDEVAHTVDGEGQRIEGGLTTAECCERGVKLYE